MRYIGTIESSEWGLLNQIAVAVMSTAGLAIYRHFDGSNGSSTASGAKKPASLTSLHSIASCASSVLDIFIGPTLAEAT
jgi:hypothetical protein